MATVVGFTLPRLTFAADTGFTVTRLREFVTSSLSDSVLQTLLDAAFEAINDVIGPPGEVAELLTASGELLWLSRRAQSVTSVVERNYTTSYTLAADDYELTQSGRLLVRMHTGTTPAWDWRWRVWVTYVPIDDMANRIRVAIELVRLDLATTSGSGVLASQTIGTWSETYVTSSANNTYVAQRGAILASLHPGMAIV